MRRSLTAAFVATSLIVGAVPAQAAGLSGMGANIFGNYFQFGKANLAKPPVSRIRVGGMSVELQHTQLTAIKKTFGGSIRTGGSGTGQATWLCYHTSGKGQSTNTWFISNSLGGGDFVMMVAVEAANPARVPGDCDAAPASFSAPQLGIPSVGSKTSDLRAAFGTASGGSKITYRADEPAADALGTANNAQYIGYVTKGGVISGVGVGETAVP